MNAPNTDLLPALFDQVLIHYSDKQAGPVSRGDILKAIHTSIINAAAECVREAAVGARTGDHTADYVQLTTFDRLSGERISRAALTDQLRTTLLLDKRVAEIALLMIEAQIDLRLKSGHGFSLAGIEFSTASESSPRIADWCQSIVQRAVDVSMRDVPTIWNRLGRSAPEGLRVLVEALQLNATLREAVRYTIRADRHLVTPLVASPGKDKRIRVLHISDLHMVEDLTKPDRGGSPTFLQAKHNFEAVRLLGRAVDALSPRFDLVVATGDLSTDGAPGSLETVLQYVQSGPVSGENRMRIAAFGLNAGKDRRVLIPGNHDRYAGRQIPGQQLSDTFEAILGRPERYPYLAGFRPHKADREALTLLLFVFDSNLRAGSEDYSIHSRIDSLARGDISEEEVDHAVSLSKNAAGAGRCQTLGSDAEILEFDPKNTVRVALLHHHPFQKATTGHEPPSPGIWQAAKHPIETLKAAKRRAEVESMKLAGADYFLEGCFRAGIQLILFGHQHYPYRRGVTWSSRERTVESPFGQASCMRGFCCPTTLQKSPWGNGFYVFDFIDKDHFSVDFYVSYTQNGGTPAPFQRVADQSGELALNQLSRQEQQTAYSAERIGS